MRQVFAWAFRLIWSPTDMLLFLLALTDEKDRDKVQEIYDKYHIEMYKIAKHKLANRPDAEGEAEEAVQNAFIKIIEHFDSIRFDESEETLRAYYLTIVTHEALNIIQKRQTPLSLHDYEDTLADEDDFIRRLCIRTEYERVVQAIINMDDQYSIPLQLKFLEMMSVKDIATMLDMKPKTVYAQISRGKLLLLKNLGEEIKYYD
jgi:RNA polymerase sigma-70 factor (ECF subfamily)